ncbi:hypothetical protein NPIL_180731 [Nephila pilipes]|uniref:DUF5641 domain-containing protein n=1 Tax=Nephila pilipes TaxID=299642 RepID=A0A8X6N3D1_NEPPI|nr:hypothetical protein NPIL_180731 [Nephila pilipes]
MTSRGGEICNCASSRLGDCGATERHASGEKLDEIESLQSTLPVLDNFTIAANVLSAVQPRTYEQARFQQILTSLEDNWNSFEWYLARVEATHPGTKDLVHVVDMTTNKGNFRRNITKLCPLPFKEDVGGRNSSKAQNTSMGYGIVTTHTINLATDDIR